MLSDPKKRARRRSCASGLNAPSGAQCFPTLVGPDDMCPTRWRSLNAPSGAQCFPTGRPPNHTAGVSMHLLVLSAFRQMAFPWEFDWHWRLNAPSGAQCFPTRDTAHQGLGRRVSMHLLVLSAFRPSGEGYEQLYSEIPVSMHLLVLSAFRQYEGYGRIKSTSGLNAPSGAQCFPTVRRANCWQPGSWSQCTFWCSVLSDSTNL